MDQPADPSLTQLLRRGGRLRELIQDLPVADQWGLVRKAGESSPKTEAALQAGLVKLYAVLGKSRRAVEDTLALWASDRLRRVEPRARLPTPTDWRGLLLLCLTAKNRLTSLPPDLKDAIERTLAGESDELAPRWQTALRDWEAATSVQNAVRSLETALEEAAAELTVRLGELIEARGSDARLTPVAWASAGSTLARLRSRWETDQKRIKRDLERLSAAAEALGEKPELDDAAAPAREDVNERRFESWNLAECHRLLSIADQRLNELMSPGPSVLLPSLIKLGEQLSARLPLRDARVLQEELSALRGLTDEAEAETHAPVLVALRAASIPGEPLNATQISLLETELSARTLRQLQANELLPKEHEDRGESPSDEAGAWAPQDISVPEPPELLPGPSSGTKGQETATPGRGAALGAPEESKQPLDASPETGAPEGEPPNGTGVDVVGPTYGATALRPDSEKTYSPPEEPMRSAESALATLLAEARLEEAYWLASALGERCRVPLWLVETVQLACRLRPGLHSTEERLRTLFANISTAVDQLEDLDSPARLLLAAACVRPALISPIQIYPVLVLHRLSEICPALPGLSPFLQALAGFAEKGRPLSPSLLSGLSDSAQLTTERSKLGAETDRWFEDAPLRNVKFKAGTDVWKHWSGQGGELREVVKDSRTGKLSFARFQEVAREWLDRNTFLERLDATDALVSQRIKRSPIRHGAMEALYRLVQDALELAERWQILNASISEEAKGPDSFEIRVLRGLKAASQQLIDSLASGGEGTDGLMHSARALLAAAAQELASDFGSVGTTVSSRDPLSERRRLLWLLPEIDPDDPIKRGAGALMDAVLRHIRAPFPAEAAALEQLKAGRIEVAQAVADQAGIELVEKDRLAREWLRRATREIDTVGDRIEQRQLQGVLTERDKTRFEGEVKQLRDGLRLDADRPDRLVSRCADLAAELDALARERANEIQDQFERLAQVAKERDLSIPPALENSIRTLLLEDSLDVASELLAEIRHGIELGQIDGTRWIDSRERPGHFEEFLSGLTALLPLSADLSRVRGALSSPEAPPELQTLDPEQRVAAAEAFAAWQTLADGRRVTGREKELLEPLIQVLRWLGFQPLEGDSGPATPRDGRRAHFRVSASLQAPVPRFGSAASGRHEVVLLWASPEPGSIAQWLRSSSPIAAEQPVTVLCFWPLDAPARRRWIHALREERQCVLLIDSCLMLWLSRFGGARRTQALFASALPGGHENPYMPDAAGGVAPEVFFGREHHVDRLWRLDGPCIVFGGRQLGKSALLRQVVRRYHDPAEQRFVFYEGLSSQLDLFEVLRSLLAREGLLKKQGLQGAARVKAAIAAMMGEQPARRILVLLDECDRFLNEDSRKSFHQAAMLRDLMTETSRRFKVVFAGLHSVQRFQRLPNQPLAHFGEPLCVGPLEPPAGRDLVQVPFEALGYRFEPPTLVNRILAHTNSHPSLVQLFCQALMEELQNRSAAPKESTPPFKIDDELIGSIYRSVKLSDRMRSRFEWTLDLDPRYRVLGYLFAFLEHEGRFFESEGAPAHEVLGWAQDFWPEGFAGSNSDELVGLLEEMKGLGLLVGNPARGYRLRSPNLLRLLGGSEDVQRELETFKGRPYRAEPEPQVIRRIPSGAQLVASPLTLDQEGRILTRERGLDLILGSAALSLEEVWAALGSLSHGRSEDGQLRVELLTLEEPDAALPRVRDLYRQLTEPGVLVLLDLAEQTPAERFRALRAIAAWLEGLTHERRFLRVVARLGPRSILEGRLSGSLFELERMEVVTAHRLRRWKEPGLTQWLHDAEVSPDTMHQPGQWVEETGGWPYLLVPRLLEKIKAKRPSTSVQPHPPPDPAEFLIAAGLEPGSSLRSVFRTLAELGGEVDLIEELPQLAADPGIENVAPRHAEALLDLDLLHGTRERARAEPVAARILLDADA